MSRQLEPLPGRRARTPTEDASSLTPASARTGSAILEFQRSYGNRHVARWVLSRQPTAPPLAESATYDNRELAKAIDEARKLDGIALLKRDEEVEAALAAGPTGAELARVSLVRDAIDFVRSEADDRRADAGVSRLGDQLGTGAAGRGRAGDPASRIGRLRSRGVREPLPELR